MTSRGGKNKDAKRLMALYDCKKHGTKYSTVLNLLKERGLEGAITQLEAWGMKPVTHEPNA
jgi:hypothetical protein